MNLVDDDELANLRAQKWARVLEAPLVSRTLKVKVDRPRLPHANDLAGQRGFADLARAEKNAPGICRRRSSMKGRSLRAIILHLNSHDRR